LFESYRGILRQVSTPEECSIFLRHLGFNVAATARGNQFCFRSPLSLNEQLANTANHIANQLKEADGVLALHGVQEAMPHLSSEALANMREQFLPEVHEVEVGGMPCWRSAEAIHLPQDFEEKLKIAVDTLVALDEKVSVANLEFALNLLCRIRVREEYSLLDNRTFMRVCAKHYQGKNDFFPNANNPRIFKKSKSEPGKRERGSNTQFSSIAVPIGAELVFTKNSHITCIVLNDTNQVKYADKAWTISMLAKHLLGKVTVNGFCFFSYQGEVLWKRRLRMKQKSNDNEKREQKKPLPAKVRGAAGKIIGLQGRPLSPTTWRAFRTAGTNPRVAEWARRVGNGESAASIASESGCMVSTVRAYIINHRRYFAVCEKNGIVPAGGTNV
jgi:hypothetical protein